MEHDFIMATYLADRVVVYSGQPGIECTAEKPTNLLEGMNQFLKQLEVTFGRDHKFSTPNKQKNSQKDKEQKSTGAYFFLDSET